MKKIGTTKDGVQKKAQSKRIGNIGASNWETEIIDKLKKLIKSSGKSIDAVFAQFDVDEGGDISASEFRKAIKMIGGLGLTDTEIDRLMQRVDADQDGQVSYQEFAAKFRDDPDFDVRMIKRANDRLAEFKEKMILYMTSSTDAYKLVSQFKNILSSVRDNLLNVFIVRRLEGGPHVLPGLRCSHQGALQAFQDACALLLHHQRYVRHY